MPKVIGYTPSWLSRPSPGFSVFTPKPTTSSKATNGVDEAGGLSRTKNTIATRGTEIFVAIGNEIRWSDLVELKEAGDAQYPLFNRSRSQNERLPKPKDGNKYRVLKAPIHGTIKQLVISPQEEFMAIVTSHTVYIAVLPNPEQFGNEANGPLKLKTWQLGPTAHVLEESPIASVIWHPLGYRGRCVVTITTDAVVRLWELNRADRLTFNEPAFAVDLKKLANATSADENLGASKYGATKGFSPDSVELEVASACFGDCPEQEGVHGWAPMTLWIAMREGDLYALCPLLPSKWQLTRGPAASTFMQTLITTINANYASLSEEKKSTPEDLRMAKQQLEWLSDISHQEPMVEDMGFEDPIDVYSRPKSTPLCPQLQGPFTLIPDTEEGFGISDIIIFSLKTLDDGGESEMAEGLPVSVICLVTDTGDIQVCLDLEGIQGRWLAPGKSQNLLPTQGPEHTLLIFETIKFLSDEEVASSSQNPTITTDTHTDYAFFVTHNTGIFYISIASWVQKLERELAEAQSEGVDFRMNVLLEGAQSLVECTIRFSRDSAREVSSCAIFDDSDIGYFLLTTVQDEPYAATLDKPSHELPVEDPTIAQYLAVDMGELAQRLEQRQPYRPPKALWTNADLVSHVANNVPTRRRQSLMDEIRLSPATLELLMDTHRFLSQETHQLGLAVADLFRRCERLKDEFREQAFRAAQLNDRVDKVTGADEEAPPMTSQTGEVYVGSKQIERRLENVKSRQQKLGAQYDRIRKKIGKVGGRDLSEKEAAWIAEINSMNQSLDPNTQLDHGEDDLEAPIWLRFDEIKTLHNDLVKQAEEAIVGSKSEKEPNGALKVTSESRKQSNEEIEELLNREDALVDAARQRLRRLGISIPP